MLIEEKLSAAYEKNPEAYLKTLVWKYGKDKDYKAVSLFDCSEEQLAEFKSHCDIMLTNNNKNNPGRLNVLKLLNTTKTKVNVEIFLRSLEGKDRSRVIFLEQIQNVLDVNDLNDQIKNLTLNDVVKVDSQLDFANIPLKFYINGCVKKLGVFDKRRFTMNFIYKQGIHFSHSEINALKTQAKELGKTLIETAKINLGIPNNVMLYLNDTGLTYKELGTALKLKTDVYHNLSDEELDILKNKLIPMLELEVRRHVEQWVNLKNSVLKVAEYKGYKI